MVAGFRRTISFPAPKSPTPPSNKSAAYRARSASLPCRFHPLVLQLDDDVADLRALVGRLLSGASAEAVAEGAEQLGRVLVSLSDLLHHPQAQDPLRRLGRSPFAERLLDDFLRLADAHGSFRDALVSLAALQAEARAALRREEPARLASAARALRRSGRDLPRIASAARTVAAKAPPPPFATPSATPRHVVVTTRPASPMPRIWWVADLMRWMSRAKRRSAKRQHADVHGAESAAAVSQLDAAVDPDELERKAAFERLDNLGRCIADVESSGEKVFRALVNTRVSLLNILSPAF
ncbi:uncharacterized protein LOC101776793 [Setaria italica]|uniref:uncharacterized protein LOC101776793 n=1 Tax=Setaria italica TaxID=4555 RepID=UPI000BE584CB|nr:uncharacterized protein LOC101776793 [Setaria italica]XP_034594349.1 uncharacterized protein LOC117856040 [Setaria viridis]